MKKTFLLGLLTLFFVGSIRAQDTTATHWWNDTTWYLLFVRSFYDSDGDGIGDLRGIIEKLDYLNDGDPATTSDLGITGIWLMPVFEAASYHGYDAVDYRAIEQDYGTQADFVDLMAAAHARGIRIIVDMVQNHTSSQHPWFQASATQDATYADWYKWADTNPGYRGPWDQTAWYNKGGRYYYAPFWSEMPDLNYDTPAVTIEMQDIAAFWLDEMDVDGFRLDAIKYLVEEEVDGKLLLANSPANVQWLADYNAFVKKFDPDAVTIGEIWDPSFSVARYVEAGAVDMAFDFDFAEALISAGKSSQKKPITDALRVMLNTMPANASATFTTNHDQPRLLTRLDGNLGANRVVASVLMTAPGAPFVYYGEEIGMSGDKPDELIRTPLQWDTTPVTGGFTTGSPWQALTPGFETATIADQTTDAMSLLSHYRSLIHLRNDNPTLRTGAMTVAQTKGGSIYSILRHDSQGTFLIIVNLNDVIKANYAITLADVALSGITRAKIVYNDGGTGTVVPPPLTADGSIVDYAPKPELAPHETLILRLS